MTSYHYDIIVGRATFFRDVDVRLGPREERALARAAAGHPPCTAAKVPLALAARQSKSSLRSRERDRGVAAASDLLRLERRGAEGSSREG